MSQIPASYVMGHDDRERRRLSLQASILNPLSDQLLRRAGLSAGLRVLDLGCGVGELSMVAARLVGRRGSVTGIDIDEGALALAAQRASEQGLDHISFAHSDIATFRTDALYDAVIGRHILIHTPEPRVVVGMAHSLLNPGGVAVFQEYDFSTVHRPFPEAPLYERTFEIFRTFFAKAAHGNIGTRLFQLLSDAGFPSPECRVEYPIDGGADSPFYEWIAESLRSILPRRRSAWFGATRSWTSIRWLTVSRKKRSLTGGACPVPPWSAVSRASGDRSAVSSGRVSRVLRSAVMDHLNFYINGAWVPPVKPATRDVINPATEQSIGKISMGSAEDVDRAVKAARKAFDTFSRTTPADRIALLENIVRVYKTKHEELAKTISMEVGAPFGLSKAAQAATGLGHFAQAIEVLKTYTFEEARGKTMVVREPVGVCGLITPWNWPINQIACKVAPALAAGCTIVLKPTEVAPLNAIVFTQILHEAGVPPGVFNLVNGDGPTVGAAIASHPDIDMVSFTGSTRAGVQVAINAAPTVKRVTQELGGKSANIILDDADFQVAVAGGVTGCFINSGQSCNAPTRMLVPASRQAEAVAIAKAAAEKMKVGDPFGEGIKLGPVVSETQFNKIQGLIQKGIDEGAQLVTGGVGRPDGLATGFYVKPTVFAGVKNSMTIAREEIFGPVLAILPYETEEEAIAMANDTPYGLSGYVSSGDLEHARRVASRLRTGNVHLNGAQAAFDAPFGGYKQSGNGREWGVNGFEEFLETKAVLGYQAK